MTKIAKVKVTWERKCKNIFVHIFVKTRSIYVKQYQNDHQPISTHISSNTFHQRKRI